MFRIESLPTELLRYIFPFLPLTSLIAARAVSSKWRALALTAPLYPARKTLLDLYLAAIAHPNFPSIVTTLRPYLHEFDREAYIEDLTSRGCVLPDLFELWILEWPSKAVHFLSWPRLENFYDMNHPHYIEDGNALEASPPTIDIVPVPKKDVSTIGLRTCRGLELFRAYLYSAQGIFQLWLVVDPNDRINDRREGRLLWTYSDFVDSDYTPGRKRILCDPPFGPPTDVGLIHFLDMLDVSSHQVDNKLGSHFFIGVLHEDDE